MRRLGRTDSNQADIVRTLRAAGCSVQSLASTGNGCPDLLVGRSGVNHLLEVKDGDKSPSKQRLTEDEIKWHDNWRGHVCVVKSVDEALRAVGATG